MHSRYRLMYLGSQNIACACALLRFFLYVAPTCDHLMPLFVPRSNP